MFKQIKIAFSRAKAALSRVGAALCAWIEVILIACLMILLLLIPFFIIYIATNPQLLKNFSLFGLPAEKKERIEDVIKNILRSVNETRTPFGISSKTIWMLYSNLVPIRSFDQDFNSSLKRIESLLSKGLLFILKRLPPPIDMILRFPLLLPPIFLLFFFILGSLSVIRDFFGYLVRNMRRSAFFLKLSIITRSLSVIRDRMSAFIKKHNWIESRFLSVRNFMSAFFLKLPIIIIILFFILTSEISTLTWLFARIGLSFPSNLHTIILDALLIFMLVLLYKSRSGTLLVFAWISFFLWYSLFWLGCFGTWEGLTFSLAARSSRCHLILSSSLVILVLMPQFFLYTPYVLYLKRIFNKIESEREVRETSKSIIKKRIIKPGNIKVKEFFKYWLLYYGQVIFLGGGLSDILFLSFTLGLFLTLLYALLPSLYINLSLIHI